MNSVDDFWIVLKERERDPFSAELVKDFFVISGANPESRECPKYFKWNFA